MKHIQATTTYTMKKIPKGHLVQNVPNTYNIVISSNQYIVLVIRFYRHSGKFISKCFILDKLLRKNHFYRFYTFNHYLYKIAINDNCPKKRNEVKQIDTES